MELDVRNFWRVFLLVAYCGALLERFDSANLEALEMVYNKAHAQALQASAPPADGVSEGGE